MNTKIKILVILACSLSLVTNIEARWYGPHAYPSNNTNCDLDSWNDPISPTNADIGPAPVGSSWAPYFPSQARASGSPGSMICEYWDSTLPTASATNSSPVWKNADISITLSASDYGGSGLNFAKYRWGNPDCWNAGTAYTNGTTINGVIQGGTTLYLCVRDGAGNQFTWSGVYNLDKQPPTASNLTYASSTSLGWQNTTSIILNWSASDIGGSLLKDIDIRVYRAQGSQNTPTVIYETLSNIVPTGNFQYLYSSLQDGYAYKFEICPRDNAGNTCLNWTTSPDIVRVDTTPPNPTSLTTSTSTSILATTSQAFTFVYNDGGAPVSIGSIFEDFTNPDTAVSVFYPSAFAYTHTSNQNIQNVDLERGLNGARPYTYRVTDICDQAGNCASSGLPRVYSYDVYANPNTTVSNISSTGGAAIADGSQNTFTHTIKDLYGNAIVPATGINRTISMDLSSINNTMFLNQYDRSGGSSVQVKHTSGVIFVDLATSTQNFSAQTSIDGSYPLQLKVYTPTGNTGTPVSDPLAGFGFTSNLVVVDSLIGPPKTFSQSLSNPSFKPLYTSQISGDLRDGGFIEGVTQASAITIAQNGTTSPPSPSLQIGFSGSSDSLFEFFGGNAYRSKTLTPFAGAQFVGTSAFSSEMTQAVQTLPAGPLGLQLSTHFSYILDGKNILYNSDIIGKTGGYWGTATAGSATQVGVKVIGPIASNVIRAIVDGQFANSTSIFGGISRSEVRNKMRQSIALATRNMTLRSADDSISDVSNFTSGTDIQGAIIDKGDSSSIIRLEKTGGKITLEATTVSGRRTLVIRGADLYIAGNMSYTDTSSILGVVVQKDDSGNGGNLYIDPSVTNIVGTYIIDGSVSSSSDGISPISVGDISTLKNQLYIYGSIVSENTIGGSRMSPVKCPTQVSGACTTTTEAQKYDLNYLRRYYLFGGQPFGNGKIIGNETCTTTTCTTTSTLPQKFTSPSEDLAQYPVIIEYNPLIRTTPPVGFELSRE